MTAAPPPALAETPLRRVLRGAGLVLSGKAAAGVLNLIAFGVAYRSLGAAAMGVVVLVHATAQASATLLKFQSWQAVLRFGAGSLEPARRAELHALLRFTAKLDLGSGLAAALACALAFWLGGALIGLPASALPAALLYATCVPVLVTATPVGIIRLLDRFDVLARRDAAVAALRLAGSLGAAFAGAGIAGFLAAWWAGAVGGGALMLLAAWRELAARGLLRPDPAGRRLPAAAAHPGVWGFAWSTNLMSSLSLGQGHLATLLVGGLLGPAAAAMFSLARRVGESALRPSRFLTPALYPELARLVAAGDRAAVARLLRRALPLSAAAAALILLALSLCGAWLLRVVGGPEAAGAAPTMLLLACAAAIGFAAFAFEPLLVSGGRHTLALRLRMAAAMAYLPAAALGLSLVGLEGAGLAAIVVAAGVAWAQGVAALHWLRRPVLRDDSQRLHGAARTATLPNSGE